MKTFDVIAALSLLATGIILSFTHTTTSELMISTLYIVTSGLLIKIAKIEKQDKQDKKENE